MEDSGPDIKLAQASIHHCDACGGAIPLEDLRPIGDGSLRVCETCYPEATRLVCTYEHH